MNVSLPKPGGSPELATPFGFPKRVAGVKALGPSVTALPGSNSGSWIGNRSNGTLGFAAGDLTHCTTMPALKVCLCDKKQ